MINQLKAFRGHLVHIHITHVNRDCACCTSQVLTCPGKHQMSVEPLVIFQQNDTFAAPGGTSSQADGCWLLPELRGALVNTRHRAPGTGHTTPSRADQLVA